MDPSARVVERVRLVRVQMPLVAPFRSAHGTVTVRDVLLVNVLGADGEGWGEVVTGAEPTYTSEFTESAIVVLRRELIPRLLRGVPLSTVKGHQMAKCGLEMAMLDLELRVRGESLGRFLGGTQTRIRPGAALGMHERIEDLIADVDAVLTSGYARVKLKIEPGRDLDVVAAVRGHVGPDTPLQVDANAAYSLDDAATLARLDEYELLFIEQPFAEGQLLAHAELARRLTTPVCLDESIWGYDVAADAIALGACSVMNIKPGRVGGIMEAKRIHDLCVDRGVAAWHGGMHETGIGRAAALAVASLPGFVYPPDLSASDRYFARDLATFRLDDGALVVPTGPGLGVRPDPAVLADLGAVEESFDG